jgi:hypothetical protein
MADAKKVTVTALKSHTHDGKAHQEGDTYPVDADQVENLRVQGMATPSDEVEQDEPDESGKKSAKKK